MIRNLGFGTLGFKGFKTSASEPLREGRKSGRRFIPARRHPWMVYAVVIYSATSAIYHRECHPVPQKVILIRTSILRMSTNQKTFKQDLATPRTPSSRPSSLPREDVFFAAFASAYLSRIQRAGSVRVGHLV